MCRFIPSWRKEERKEGEGRKEGRDGVREGGRERKEGRKKIMSYLPYKQDLGFKMISNY